MLELKSLSRPGLRVDPFTIAAGECVAVLGPSGAGKSLLLRAIADLDPNQGEIMINDLSRNKIPAPEWRKLVAYLPAESGWWADTVAEHLPHTDKRVSRFLKALLLPDDCLNWQITRLSSGEKQRLALLRLLLNQPKILLLDEPTAALDMAAVQAVERVLDKQQQEGVAILLVTHDEQQAKRLAKRRLSVADGHVHEDTTA